MRRAALALGSCTLLAGAVFACESDPDGVGGPSFELDGSVPTFDGGQQPFDAGTPDSSPDAPPGPPSVTVTVTDRSGAKAGTRVVFHDASGAVIEDKVTDASGKAKSTTAALPAMATALLTSDRGRQLVTWTAIEDGDDLAVRAQDTEDGELGRFDVSLPALLDGTEYWYGYASGCSGEGGGGTSGSIQLYPFCARQNTTSVLAYAYDAENQVIGHSFKKGIAVPASGVAPPVTTGAWASPTVVTLTAANTPNRAPQVELLEIADGHGYENGFRRPLENGSATFPAATGFADALQGSLRFTTAEGGEQVIAKRVPPTTTITFDAADVLPAIANADIADGTNGKRPVISWESSASTASADGGLVRLQFWGRNEEQYVWTIVVPPGSTTVSAPALPTDADEFLPDADAGQGWYPPEVGFIEADVIPTYKAFRTQQGTLAPAGTSLTFGFPALPVNGTYRATGWVFAF